MDRKPLYAQFDGDDVDGKRYSLGEKLASDTDAGTAQYLASTGRFSTSKPGEPDGSTIDTNRATAGMSRAELLAELAAGEDDDRLRSAVEDKRAMLKEREEDDRRRIAADEENDPLNGNADKAIDYVATLSDVSALETLKGRETNGKKRSTILAAIDKRIEAVRAQ